ncbi:MAG: VTT domain-containing protein [Planctomycetota bacterium]|nr:VTT domain-containing protein [Planctomycetota bacterium]
MKRKVIVFAMFVAVCCFLLWIFERWLSLEQLIVHESWLRQQVNEHPWRSGLLGFLIYVAASLIPGTGGKSIVYGWIFGCVAGVGIVTLALTFAATISFCLSRYVLGDVIDGRFGHYVARIDRALERDGGFYLFALRVAHFPYTLTNYAMGATTIRARSFVLATLLGLLPGSFFFAYAGSQLPTLRTLAERGVFGVVSPQLLIAVVLLAIAPIAIRVLLRRLGLIHTPTQLS